MMGLRNLLQDKPVVGVVIMLVLIGVAYGLSRRGSDVPPPPVASGLYFYDLGTGETFIAPLDAVAPIDAPSGPKQGVFAHVFACGQCATSPHEVLYLETVDGDPSLQTSRRVAAVPKPGEDPHWLAVTSAEGQAVTSQFINHCDGSRAERCNPQ